MAARYLSDLSTGAATQARQAGAHDPKPFAYRAGDSSYEVWPLEL